MLVPPVVMTKSASSFPLFSAAVVASIVSPQMPRSTVGKFKAERTERSVGRFESTMPLKLEEGLEAVVEDWSSRSSLPVERMAMVGRR